MKHASDRRARGTGQRRRAPRARARGLATHTRGVPGLRATGRRGQVESARAPDRAASRGKQVVGYGAPGKGNTLLNYCGIRTDLLDYTVDRNPYKHGKIPSRHPHPDLSSRADRRDATRRHRDPALESPAGDRGAARLRARVGRAADRADSRARSSCPGADVGRGAAMKVVIFCGGLGPADGRDVRAHPEADDPDRRQADPLAHHELLLELRRSPTSSSASATRPEAIKEYFLTYNEALANDFVLSDGGKRVELLQRDIHNWSITFLNTGLHALIGQRLKKVQSYLDDDDIFLATYGDGLTDAPLPEMIDALDVERQRRALPRLPPDLQLPRRHVRRAQPGVEIGAGRDRLSTSGSTPGFFVFRREFFDYLGEGEDLVEEPFRAPDRRGQAGRVPVRRVLGADGHAQGQAPSSRACYESGQAPWRIPSGAPQRPARRPVPPSRCTRWRSTPIGGSRRSSRSAPTPTTSRSAAAARSSRSPQSHPDAEVVWVVLSSDGDAGRRGPAQRGRVPPGLLERRA